MTAPQVPGDGKEGQGREALRAEIERLAYPLRAILEALPAPSSAAPVTGDEQPTCRCDAMGKGEHRPDCPAFIPRLGDAQRALLDAADAIKAFRESRPSKSPAHYRAALSRAEEIVRARAAALSGDTGNGQDGA